MVELKAKNTFENLDKLNNKGGDLSDSNKEGPVGKKNKNIEGINYTKDGAGDKIIQ